MGHWEGASSRKSTRGFGHSSIGNFEAQTRQQEDEARSVCRLTHCTCEISRCSPPQDELEHAAAHRGQPDNLSSTKVMLPAKDAKEGEDPNQMREADITHLTRTQKTVRPSAAGSLQQRLCL